MPVTQLEVVIRVDTGKPAGPETLASRSDEQSITLAIFRGCGEAPAALEHVTVVVLEPHTRQLRTHNFALPGSASVRITFGYY
jgi:hypothetical protein